MGISFIGRVTGLVAVLVLVVAPADWLRAEDAKTITGVQVDDTGDATRIILTGAYDPIYTAFMREDPPQLIVELPDVRFEGVQTPIMVGNDLVGEVTLAAFGSERVSPSVGRVSVNLNREAEYEIIPNGSELVIELRALHTTGSGESAHDEIVEVAEVEASQVPAALAETSHVTELQQDGRTDFPDVSEAKSEDAPAELVVDEPAPAISRINRVVAIEDVVRIDAIGPIDNVDSFVLDSPERVVVDFWGAENTVSPAVMNVSSGVVERVRIGQHMDKVRVVIDLRAKILSHVVEPTSLGVRIVFDPAGKLAEEAVTEMVPAAPAEAQEEHVQEETAQDEPVAELETAAEPEAAETVAEEPGTSEPSHGVHEAMVSTVHFESLPGVDRVVLSLDSEVETRVAEPQSGSVIVDLMGARISGDKERRVDTTEFGGPLQLFSVFQTPDVPGAQVRIVLKHHGGLHPELVWEGSQLTIELRHEEAGEAPSEPDETPSTTVPDSMTSGLATVAQDPEAPEASQAPSASAAVPQPASPAATQRAVRLPARVPIPAAPFGDDSMLAGPADPASIDVLEEGGFSEEKTYKGRRISLDFKDADIGNILRLIAEVSDLNIIAGEEVEGKVTIRLVDVPWDQAMDVILMTKGLGFLRVGNVLRIAPLETLKLENEARLQERRAKEKLEDLVVKLQPVNYAAVSDIQDLVQRLLSSRGSVNTDERTNTLIIKDIPSVIHEATALIKAIDTQTPQVLIEAKIVEASLNFSRSLGAIWGAGYLSNGSDGGDGEFRLANGTNDSLLSGAIGDGSQSTNFVSSNPVVGLVNGFLTLGTLGLDDHLQLDLQLLAAEENNKGKVISSPRIVTLDNRQAVIKQGVAIKFTEITRDTVTTSFVDAVLELEVTPHITANRAIIMKIKVSRNAPQLSTASGDIVGIAKNETETEALVHDGETMVLGGIYVVDNGKARTKFPFLADIPLIGMAFKSKSITDARRELLIFVTPRIVTGPASDL